MKDIETIREKRKQADELLSQLEISTALRKHFDLPMDEGVVSVQRVSNGYGEIKELRIKFNGSLIFNVKEFDNLPQCVRTEFVEKSR
mgnify:CR=1 FL=1